MKIITAIIAGIISLSANAAYYSSGVVGMLGGGPNEASPEVFFTYLVGALAIGFTVAAYYQKDIKKFLKINIFASFFFALSLLIDMAITGGIIVLLSTCVYIIALMTSDDTKKRLSIIIPPIAFVIAFFGYETQAMALYSFGFLIPYIPATASLIITLSALQINIIYNKILLSIGLVLWIIYTLIYEAWFAFTADSLGLISVLVSLYILKGKKKKNIATH